MILVILYTFNCKCMFHLMLFCCEMYAKVLWKHMEHVHFINVGMFTLTVPGNFDSLLMEYTLTGYRVIALAYKNLSPKFNWKQAQRTDRDQVA